MQNLDLAQNPTARSFSCKTSIEYNDFGHIVLNFMGSTITGAEEVLRLSHNGEAVTPLARSCFTYPHTGGYDACHQLKTRPYSVALVPTKVLPEDVELSLENLLNYGMEKFGYGKPKAGLLRPVLEGLSIEQMDALGVAYLCALHDPLMTHDEKVNMLHSYLCLRDGQRYVGAYLYAPRLHLDSRGALIFPITSIHYS